MKRTIECMADEVVPGQLIHVPAVEQAPDRLDPIEWKLVDFETGMTTIKAGGETWSVRSDEYVKVVPQ